MEQKEKGTAQQQQKGKEGKKRRSFADVKSCSDHGQTKKQREKVRFIIQRTPDASRASSHQECYQGVSRGCPNSALTDDTKEPRRSVADCGTGCKRLSRIMEPCQH